jgi:AAA domain
MEPTNRTGDLPPGIDVRGRGYVIAPASMVASGQGWFVAAESLSPIDDIESIPELPAWLRNLIEAKKVHTSEVPRASTASSPAFPARERAYGERALAGIADDLAKVTRGRNTALNNAAFLAGQLAGAGRVSEGEAKAALSNACQVNGYIKKDTYTAFLATFHTGFNAGLEQPAEALTDKPTDPEDEPWVDWDADGNIINLITGRVLWVAPANRNDKPDEDEAPEQKPRPTIVKPLSAFVAEYQPISYTLDGILPSASLYFVTARSGTGKTAFNVLFVLAVASGRADLRWIKVEQGRVAYLVFENPDDVRAKLMVAMLELGIDASAINNIVIIDRHAKIDIIFRDLKADADNHGPFQAGKERSGRQSAALRRRLHRQRDRR